MHAAGLKSVFVFFFFLPAGRAVKRSFILASFFVLWCCCLQCES